MSKYDQVEHGDWMHLPRRGMKLACCDCGLVHYLKPRLDARGRIWVRVFRDDRATAGVRKARPLRGVARAIRSGGEPDK